MRLKLGRSAAVVLALLLVARPSDAGNGSNGVTELASADPAGLPAEGSVFMYTQPWSADGRYLVFWSGASNLDPSDVHPGWDCFIHDRWSSSTTLLNKTSTGIQGTGGSSGPVITPDGRFAAFGSAATELVPVNNNTWDDVFVKDLVTGDFVRVSDGFDGSPGDWDSGGPTMSANGQQVAFSSRSTNLVANDTNGVQDVFVHDRTTGITTRISVDSTGTEANGKSVSPHISADGRYVAFQSGATNLGGSTSGFYDVLVHDRVTAQTIPVVVHLTAGSLPLAQAVNPVISADGRFVAFESSHPDLVPGDTNDETDVFVRDLWQQTTILASLAHDGAQANDGCFDPSISADGRHVAFWSAADNLVPGDVNDHRDVFVRDLELGTTTLISVSTAGTQAHGLNQYPAISPDGTLVAFESDADDLVPGITSFFDQVYVRTCPPQGPATYCPAQPNALGCQADIGFTGSPSATAGAGFDVTAANLANQKFGLLLYSKTAAALKPFSGHLLCVAPPLRRTPIQLSGGSPPPATDCSGAFAFDFNAWVASGNDPALVPGQPVWAQYWSRDPQASASTNLSDALSFVIGN